MEHLNKNLNSNSEYWQLLIRILYEIAQQKGISHSQIAEKCGLIESNVSRIFSLRFRPRLDIYLSICQAVGVNLFIEDKDSLSDLNQCFEKAMEHIGRRPKYFPNN